MQWRNLLGLPVSTSPRQSLTPNGRLASRIAKRNDSHMASRRATFEALQSRQLFAADLAETAGAEVAICDILPDESASSEQVELRMVATGAMDELETKSIDWDYEAELDNPELMMMSFRGGVEDNVDGVVGEDLEVVDGVLSDDDLIFTTLGLEEEVQTTIAEELSSAKDINGDGVVTALDLLLVINALNDFGSLPSSELAGFAESSATVNWDINRDGFVTPLDALVMTNYFNGDENGQESSLVAMDSRMWNPGENSDEAPVEDEFMEDAVDAAVPLIEDLSNEK